MNVSKSNPLVLSMHLKVFAIKMDRLKGHFVIFECLQSTMINFLSSYLIVSIYDFPLPYMHVYIIEYLSKTYVMKRPDNVSKNIFAIMKSNELIFEHTNDWEHFRVLIS